MVDSLLCVTALDHFTSTAGWKSERDSSDWPQTGAGR
jgi:hypothetical protein